MLTALCDAIIFTGEAMVEGHALLIQNGKIVDIVGNRKIAADAKKISHPDAILAPGFIDAQVNGGDNILFNNSPTAESCVAIAKAHEKFGTTRMLITCISDTSDITRRAITAMREARKVCKNILGIHIEGPHVSMEARGVHGADKIRALSDADLETYRREGDEVMLVTVAPENVTPEQIKKLREQGVIVSIGHTNATSEQVRAAFAAGATGFTHIFSGTKPGSKDGGKIPIPIQAALDDPGSWCSIIGDGYHVTPDQVRTIMNAKPRGKAFWISDAMAPAASDHPKPFQLYGETIHVEKGRCINSQGKLAGAAITMLDAVRHHVKNVDVPIEEALRMASTYPAAFLGVDQKLGKLLPGFEADVVVLDHKLNLQNII